MGPRVLLMASCPTCSRSTTPDQRFCASCGATLGLDDLPTGTAPRSPSPRPTAALSPGAVSGAPRTLAPSTPSAPHPRFVPGTVFAGRYRVVGLLGRGGMGEVYRADDLRLEQAVALKFLPETLKDDPVRLERFHNEVRVARQLAHPAVCRVYDIGEADGQPFLSMEYVDGEDLASLLRRIGRLPHDKAVDIARQLCAGLAAAHDRGILHRDLKPDNVMLDGRGKVRVTDFGLAALAATVAGDDVRSGTPAYMAPEQLEGREVTTASDVYALGLVLYELFTGHKPFEGRTLAELTRQHREQTPREPSRVVEDITPAVERIILRCLEKDPRLRPPSALAVAAALPGGDPLAAALAAGETPSPEMVAASGAMEGLSPAAAWGWLVGVAGLAAVAVVSARAYQLAGYVSLDKPPQALEDRAREIAGTFGPDRPAADTAAGFRYDGDYLRHIEARETSPDRWAVLRANRPAALLFYYRESPRALVPSALTGRVSIEDPPLVLSGMSTVELDPQGRLVAFASVPPQLESEMPAGAAAPAVDWGPLFAEARLDPSRFTPAPPRWTPPFHSDARAAWIGSDASRPDLPLRIEAASYRGRPVYFRTLWEWTRAERMQESPARPGQTAANRLGLALILGIACTALALARMNVRLGRGDRGGARRLAAVTLAGELVVWALTAHHVADAWGEMMLVVRGLGLALLLAGVVWLLYLAIEPYVRRHWPDSLVSWTRLLAGRLRDPLVGRDVLVGLALGAVVTSLIPLAHVFLPRWIGRPPLAPGGVEFLYVLLATRFVAGGLVDLAVSALLNGMLMVLVLTGFRLVLRREWLAAAAFMVVLSLQSALRSPLPFAVALAISLLAGGVPLYVALRQGVLVTVVSFFVTSLLLGLPAAPSPGHWSAGPIELGLAVLGVMLVYAFRMAERAQPLPRPAAL